MCFHIKWNIDVRQTKKKPTVLSSDGLFLGFIWIWYEQFEYKSLHFPSTHYKYFEKKKCINTSKIVKKASSKP